MRKQIYQFLYQPTAKIEPRGIMCLLLGKRKRPKEQENQSFQKINNYFSFSRKLKVIFWWFSWTHNNSREGSLHFDIACLLGIQKVKSREELERYLVEISPVLDSKDAMSSKMKYFAESFIGGLWRSSCNRKNFSEKDHRAQ